MTFTYTNAPATSPVDEVRMLIGDTDSTKPFITDEEINYCLMVYPKQTTPVRPAYLAAAAAVDVIISQIARKVNRSLARGLFVQASQQTDHFVALAASLRLLYATGGLGTHGARPAIADLGGGGPTILGNEPAYRRVP